MMTQMKIVDLLGQKGRLSRKDIQKEFQFTQPHASRLFVQVSKLKGIGVIHVEEVRKNTHFLIEYLVLKK